MRGDRVFARALWAALAAFFALEIAIEQPVGADPTQGSVVTTAVQSSLYNGQVFLAGSSATGLVVGQAFRYLVKNPANSGKTCFVFEMHAYSNVAISMRVLVDPTTNLPTTTRPLTNTMIGSLNTPICQIYADAGTVAESGGTDTGVDFQIPAGERDLPAIPIAITPGHAIGFTTQPAIAAITANVVMYEREF